MVKYQEQPYLHREGVQWVVMGVGGLAAVAGLWFGGRRAAGARRRWIRQVVREELEAVGALRGELRGGAPRAGTLQV